MVYQIGDLIYTSSFTLYVTKGIEVQLFLFSSGIFEGNFYALPVLSQFY